MTVANILPLFVDLYVSNMAAKFTFLYPYDSKGKK